jgi:NADPH:quinone reductase-like Zn-dependent oxidoreductase
LLINYASRFGETAWRERKGTMRQWVIERASSLDGLKLVEAEPAPGRRSAVRVRACSLNYRDQLIPLGHYFGGTVDRDTVPLSDGAGEVEAVGEGVTAFAWATASPGCFSRTGSMGRPIRRPAGAGRTAGHRHVAGLGGPARTGRGALAQSLSLRGGGLPALRRCHRMECLMEGPRPVRAGASVLVLGTGGVSLLALQIAWQPARA